MTNIKIDNINLVSEISLNPNDPLSSDLSGIRVLVMIPCYGSMPTETVESLIKLQEWALSSNIGRFQIMIESGNAMITHARNRLAGGDNSHGADQKPWEDFTHFFSIDSDIIFDPWHFAKLLTSSHAITSGVYYGKNQHKLPVAYSWDEEFFKQHNAMPTIDPAQSTSGGVMFVDLVGMGFCVIKREVFEKLQYPWFTTEQFTIGDVTDLLSEDTSFCRRATEAGFSLVLDTSVRLGHVGKHIYHRNDE